MRKDVLKLLEFSKFYHKFQQTQRMIYAVGENRKENDSEHSFQVAFTAWYLIDAYGFKYNLKKVFKYAIVHDLLEIYAGDSYFDIKGEERLSKLEKEVLSLKRIKEEFPEFGELTKIISDYENKIDKEARFVNAVEKIIPVINLYLDGGRTWKEEGMTYKNIVENKDPRIAISKDVEKFWKEFKKILKESNLLK